MTTLAVNGTTADGHISASSSVWATVRAATSGTVQAGLSVMQCKGMRDGSFLIFRTFMFFDTSGVGTDTVDSGTLGVNVTQAVGTVSGVLVAGSQNSPLQAGDFDAFGADELSNRVAMAVGAKTFTLNAAGLAAINKTGVTRLCIRMVEHDVDGTTPTDGVYRYVTISSQESGSGPLLTLQHSAVVVGNPWHYRAQQ